MIKFIVSDIDGTLMGKEKQIAKSDKEGLQAAVSQGLKVCLASGRMNEEMEIIMKECGIHYYRVSQNGAYVHDESGILLYSSVFQADLINELFSAVDVSGILKVACTAENRYIMSKDEYSDRIERRFFAPFVYRNDLEQTTGKELDVCKISLYGNPQLLRMQQSKLIDRFSGRVDIFFAEEDCLDLMPTDVSKGASLLTLLRAMGLKPEETACIGDSFNDLSMFAVTPHSFAMASAHPDVRGKAEHTVHSVEEAVQWVFRYNSQPL
jgi:Cof subfamily protein (haloacid dehalogenase superfamily)